MPRIKVTNTKTFIYVPKKKRTKRRNKSRRNSISKEETIFIQKLYLHFREIILQKLAPSNVKGVILNRINDDVEWSTKYIRRAQRHQFILDKALEDITTEQDKSDSDQALWDFVDNFNIEQFPE